MCCRRIRLLRERRDRHNQDSKSHEHKTPHAASLRYAIPLA
jgi:hypothetical protein